MSLHLILVILIVLLLVGSLPTWGYMGRYGVWPSSVLGTVLLVLLILYLLGHRL
jgi:Protein of unknown function (DUF3309)